MTGTDGYLIGVDGGGTGCRVAVGTAQKGVMGTAQGGPANVSTHFDNAIANILSTVHDALAKAGMQGNDLSHATAHLGLAGADLDAVQQQTAATLPFGTTRVSGDRQTTVAGVLGAQDGYVVALGTGTIIACQTGSRVKTVGGWGFQLSDQASGAWLGRALLTDVINAEEGITMHSPLTRTIAARLGGVQGIFQFSTTATPKDYATFAPEIFAAGSAADDHAVTLLIMGTRYIEKGLTALGYASGDVLSLAGGVGPHYQDYLSTPFRKNLHPAQGNALEGAFALAKAAASRG